MFWAAQNVLPGHPDPDLNASLRSTFIEEMLLDQAVRSTINFCL